MSGHGVAMPTALLYSHRDRAPLHPPPRATVDFHEILTAFGGFPGCLRTMVESAHRNWSDVATLALSMVADANGQIHGRIPCPVLATGDLTVAPVGDGRPAGPSYELPRVINLTSVTLTLEELDALDNPCPHCAAAGIAAEAATLTSLTSRRSLGQNSAWPLHELLAAASLVVPALAKAEAVTTIQPLSETRWYEVTEALAAARAWGSQGVWGRALAARDDLLDRLANNGRTSGELDEWARRYHLWTSCCEGTVDREGLGHYVTVPGSQGQDIVLPVPHSHREIGPDTLMGQFDSFATRRPSGPPHPTDDVALWDHWRSLPAHSLAGRPALVAVAAEPDHRLLGYLIGFVPRAMVVDAHTADFLAYRARVEGWESAIAKVPTDQHDLDLLEATADTLVRDGMSLDDALTSALAATN